MPHYCLLSCHYDVITSFLKCIIISLLSNNYGFIVMQEASDALSKTADSDTVSTYQVSSVQLVTDKKLEAFNKA